MTNSPFFLLLKAYTANLPVRLDPNAAKYHYVKVKRSWRERFKKNLFRSWKIIERPIVLRTRVGVGKRLLCHPDTLEEILNRRKTEFDILETDDFDRYQYLSARPAWL